MSERISDEVLEKLADGLPLKYVECELFEYGELELLIVNMARELLEARKELSDLQSRLKEAVEEIKNIPTTYVGQIWVKGDALDILSKHGLIEEDK